MNEAALPQSTVHIAQADPDGILLVIHAGAGNRGKKDTPERRAQVEQDLNRALEAGYALLEQGAPGPGPAGTVRRRGAGRSSDPAAVPAPGSCPLRWGR